MLSIPPDSSVSAPTISDKNSIIDPTAKVSPNGDEDNDGLIAMVIITLIEVVNKGMPHDDGESGFG